MIEYRPEIYHERAIRDIVANPARGIFADPGSGKTGLSLEAYRILRGEFLTQRALVVAPVAVAAVTWPAEVRKWRQFADFTTCLLQGPDRANRLHQRADLTFINPENIQWLEDQRGWDWPDMLIVDESTRFKSLGQRWYSLKRQCWYGKKVDGVMRAFSRRFARRLILTGTPAPNGLMDLWAQCFLLDGGAALCPTIGAYKNKYFVPVEAEGDYAPRWVPKVGGAELIYDRLRPLITRISREEIGLGLEDPRVVERVVELPDDARSRYEQMREELILSLAAGDVVAPTAASLTSKLRQIANGRVYLSDQPEGQKRFEVIHDAKLDALESIVDELAGKPVVIFYEFRHDLAAIKSLYPNAPVIGAGTKVSDLAGIVDAWNAGLLPVLIIHPMSGGHGLNLQDGGHSIVWYSLPWDLELYAQAVARLWRRGQQHTVIVYHILAARTIDARVSLTLRRKDAEQQSLLDALRGEILGVEHALTF